MFKLLLLFFVVAIDQNAAYGKPLYGDFRSILQLDFSASSCAKSHEKMLLSPDFSLFSCDFMREQHLLTRFRARRRRIADQDSADPANDLQAKRNSYHTTRVSEVLNLAEPSSLCYFIQQSETESQISCRLRFTRSKFNFNPFGLRFGKRQEGILASDAEMVSQNGGKVVRALLKLRPDRMIN